MTDSTYRINREALTDPQAITYAELLDLMVEVEAQKPVVYYGDTDAVACGETYEVRPLDDDPFLVVHPDDLAILREQLPNVRFVHLRDKPPMSNEKLHARLRRMMEMRK